MVTMQQIADMAGVHKSTVDKVVHNRPGVSQPVRRKIQKLLDEYDYQPNQAAQALQYRKRQWNIGIVLVQVDALPVLQGGILRGLKVYKDFNIKTRFVTVRTWEADKMAESIRSMTEERFDGIILSPINAEGVRKAVTEATERGVPVVTVNADLEGVPRMCFVGQDGVKASRVAGRLMAECLNKKGRIAVVTSAVAEENNNYYVKIREESFIQYVRQKYPNIIITDCIESMENMEMTCQKIAELLEKEPELDGIYITCGGVAEVAETVARAGKAGTIKIIRYESYPKIIEWIKAGCITLTIDSEIERQGRLAVQNLMQFLLNGRKPETNIFTDITIVLKELL